MNIKGLPSFTWKDVFIKNMDKGSMSEHVARDARILLRACLYFLPYKWYVVGGFVASLIVSASTAGTAWLLKPALDDIFINKNSSALVLVPLAFIFSHIGQRAGTLLSGMVHDLQFPARSE